MRGAGAHFTPSDAYRPVSIRNIVLFFSHDAVFIFVPYLLYRRFYYNDVSFLLTSLRNVRTAPSRQLGEILHRRNANNLTWLQLGKP